MSPRKVQRRVSQYNNVPDKDVDPYAEDFEYQPGRAFRGIMYGCAFSLLAWLVVGLIAGTALGLIFR